MYQMWLPAVASTQYINYGLIVAINDNCGSLPFVDPYHNYYQYWNELHDSDVQLNNTIIPGQLESLSFTPFTTTS